MSEANGNRFVWMPEDIDDGDITGVKKSLLAKLQEARAFIKYSDDEARDEHGRFMSSGSSGESIPSQAKLSGMEKVPGPLGSQGGTWYKDSSTGKTYLAKPLKSDTHGYNEVAAGAVYHEAGVKFPNTGLTEDANGKPLLVSEKIEGLGEKSASWWKSHPEAQAKAAENFGVDALLSHWDVHGLSADNTLIDKNGEPVRIESGGAMAFRAMGDPKTSFSAKSDWVEPESMRTSQQGRAMYGKMTDAQAADSLERAGRINLDNVQSRWDAMGVPRKVSDPWMATLRARQAQIPDIVARLRSTSKSLTELITKARTLVKYDEDEARNAKGEWTASGSGSIKKTLVDVIREARALIKYDPDQARDSDGRFGEGDSADKQPGVIYHGSPTDKEKLFAQGIRGSQSRTGEGKGSTRYVSMTDNPALARFFGKNVVAVDASKMKFLDLKDLFSKDRSNEPIEETLKRVDTLGLPPKTEKEIKDALISGSGELSVGSKQMGAELSALGYDGVKFQSNDVAGKEGVSYGTEYRVLGDVKPEHIIGSAVDNAQTQYGSWLDESAAPTVLPKIAASLAKYSPDQERDSSGRFASGSGESKSTEEVPVPTKMMDGSDVTKSATDRMNALMAPIDGTAQTRDKCSTYEMYSTYMYAIDPVINGFLRGKYTDISELEYGAPRVIGSVEDQAKAIDRAIEKQPLTTEDTTVYRGTRMYGTTFERGMIFSDRGFASTTKSGDVLTSVGGYGSREVLMTINIPAGSCVLDMNQFLGEQQSPLAYEHEVLLPRNSIFTVDDVSIGEFGQTSVTLTFAGYNKE